MQHDFDVLITAEEAWPAFERAVLAAKTEVIAGFRIFDLSTRLISDEARAIGESWFDLLAHVIRSGVRFKLIVSDFDPVMATSLHEQAWITVRQGAALAEIADAVPGQVDVKAALHPARAGLLPWLAFIPIVLRKKWAKLRDLDQDRQDRQAVRLSGSILPKMHTVSHHQKIAVIDGEVLYVGGLDLNERRRDSIDHDQPAHETWSDVQLILRGPEAVDARKHLETFVAVTNRQLKLPDLPSLKRTISVPRKVSFPFLSPRTLLREIEQAHLDAFAAARHLIYIETQFLRSGIIAKAMAEAARVNPKLRAVVVMPTLPEVVAFENSEGIDARYGLALEREAVNMLTGSFEDRITIATPVRPVMAARDAKSVLSGSPIIHVHNKVLIRDDDYALIGSANLNGRSMRWDTEVAVEISEPGRVALTRQKLLGHWWFDELPPEALEPQTLQRWWRDEITRNGVKRPEGRRGFLVPYNPESGEELYQPLPGVTENMV
jgi:hypothetical protein